MIFIKESIVEPIKDWTWDRKRDIIAWFESVRRFFYYGWKLRKAYEFDSHSVYIAEKAAIDRLVEFMKSGKTHLTWNANSKTNLMKKLLEYQALLAIIETDDWHVETVKFLQKYRTDGWDWNIPDELKPEWRLASAKDRARHKRVMDRYYYLRERYLEHWWD